MVGQEGSFYTQTSYLLISGVVTGTTYRFRLRSRNKWGISGVSAETSISASTAPGQMQTPTTEISGANFRIAWDLPEEYGSQIDAYEILIRTSQAVFEEQTGYCDGSLSTTVDARECEIPLSVLRQSPFSLA